MTNHDLSRALRQLGQLLEIKGDNPFKIRAHYNAAQTIEGLPEDVASLARADKLDTVPGVGEGIARKLKELVDTGSCSALEELKKEYPAGLLEMMSLSEVGPKTVKLLYEKLQIASVSDLEKACREGRIRSLPRMGEKTELNILAAIEGSKKRRERWPLGVGLPLARALVAEIEARVKPERISYAGSVRRMKETVKDIDILVSSKRPKEVMEAFLALPDLRQVLAKGDTKSSALFGEDQLQVDLRVVPIESYGAALQYFTGSKEHNVKLRALAQKKGLTINEYGVVREKDGKRIAGATEEEVYAAVGLPFIPPELREDRGELEAAQEGTLPELVTLDDLRGDLHMHTDWTDGTEPLEVMVAKAASLGYEYVCVSDHSKAQAFLRGLDEARLDEQAKAIAAVQKKHPKIRILRAIECDIKPDGTMDLDDEALSKLDIVVGAIHSRFKDDRETITKRVERALSNPHVDILAHPTGRLLGDWQGQLAGRDAYEIDLERVIQAAKAHGKAIELNAYPARLDLDDVHCRRAKALGVPVSIDCDSHSTAHLENMPYGVATARRGWLTKKDVLNCRPLSELLAWTRRG